MTPGTDTIKVWDPLVRIGHWTLVTAFFVAYFTEEDLLTPHVWAGYTVAAVIVLRVLWGLVGTEFARFGNFVRGPGETLRYLADIARNRARRFIGHNPAGGAMIVAMLASLTVTTYSGLEIYAIEENAGPLAAITEVHEPGSPDLTLVSVARADDDSDSDSDHDNGHESAEEFWEEVHEVSANLTLLLVGLHVLGVILASYSHRENLVKAMVTGRKRA